MLKDAQAAATHARLRGVGLLSRRDGRASGSCDAAHVRHPVSRTLLLRRGCDV